MSGRRRGNRISGPNSALTDFLAANNISAAQIRNDYEQRRRRATQANDDSATPTDTLAAVLAEQILDGAEGTTEEEEEDEIIVTAKTKNRKQKEDLAAKKAAEKKKLSRAGKKRDSDDDSDFSDDGDLIRGAYKKARPAPGQFANCETCEKRFTVTPYTKEGPEGGLLCTPCGKQFAKEANALNKASKAPVVRKKRKLESDKMDGLTNRGAKSLQQICIEKIVANHEEVEELGDLPPSILGQLGAIFSKRRVMKPNTLPLFLRPDLPDVTIYDAAYLEVDDYKHIFAVVPHIRKLVLENACQFKDEVVEYMLERCTQLEEMRIYAPNLVSNEMWTKLFASLGPQLKTVKLKWLDASFEDQNVADIVANCGKLQRLKLKYCRRLGEQTLREIIKARSLQHLSLRISNAVSNEALVDLLNSRGPGLQTLSLEGFQDAGDEILQAIHSSCHRLAKLRFSENDIATNAGYTALFKDWSNPPLTYIDVNCARDIDNNNPDGPEDAIGMASESFIAMMAHSGAKLRHLDVSSCRHIGQSAFLDVFNGHEVYPDLAFINISFCSRVDTTTIVGIFKSCPALKKLVAFGCFDIGEVVVPRDIALIGIPKAQDAIEQFGVGIGVDEAVVRMIEVGA